MNKENKKSKYSIIKLVIATDLAKRTKSLDEFFDLAKKELSDYVLIRPSLTVRSTNFCGYFVPEFNYLAVSPKGRSVKFTEKHRDPENIWGETFTSTGPGYVERHFRKVIATADEKVKLVQNELSNAEVERQRTALHYKPCWQIEFQYVRGIWHLLTMK